MQLLLGILSKFTGPLGWIFNLLLGFLWKKGEERISQAQKDKENHEKQVAQAAQDTKKAKEVTPDSSEKEVDDAIDDSLRNL